MPEQGEFEYRYVVQTDKFEAAEKDPEAKVEAFEAPAAAGEASDQQDEPTWKGKVIKIDRQNGNVETEFSDLAGLKAALAA